MAKWYFRKKQLGEQNREPIHGEFFASDAISDPGKALVREGIQNSLDASLNNGKPVIVRIFLANESNAVQPCNYEAFFEGAWDHFNAEKNGLLKSGIPTQDSICTFIVFEDFNTRGLQGDLSAGFQPPSGEENHFYHFFRAEGQSDKGASKRGSWGVGKTVFLRSSRLSTVFGLTVREDDKLRLLMAKSVLRSHYVGRDHFQDGYFGIPPVNEPNLVMPVEDIDILTRFCETFNIERGVKEPGLSLVIPWHDQEISEKDIIKAVLRDYFYPILDNQLEVIVEVPGIETILDSKNLMSEVSKLDPEIVSDLKPTINLAIWAQGVKDEDRFVIGMPDPPNVWKWSKGLFSTNQLESMKKCFREGGPLSIRIPVTVCKVDDSIETSYFDIYFVRDSSEKPGRPTFIREGIIISDVNAPRTRGVRALVIAGDKPIAEFLREAENPSHTDWDHARLKNNYKRGYATNLNFVKHSLHELINLLTAEEREEDKTLLADVFCIPAPPDLDDPDDRPEPRPTPKPGSNPAEPPPPPPPPRKNRFKVTKQDGGFAILKGDPESELPGVIDVRVAYDIRRGNPLKKYHIADFDLGAAPVRLQPPPSGVEIVKCSGNTLVAKVTDEDFSIHVIGFDPRRQLYVKVLATGVSDGSSKV